MSFNDADFLFSKFNFAIDKAWDESVSNNAQPFVPPSGTMNYLDGSTMEYLNGNTMTYLES